MHFVFIIDVVTEQFNMALRINVVLGWIFHRHCVLCSTYSLKAILF